LGLRADAATPRAAGPDRARAPAEEERIAAKAGAAAGGAVLRLRFEGARATAPRAEAPGGGRVSYFLGNDPSKWRTDLPVYGALVAIGAAYTVAEDGRVGLALGAYRPDLPLVVDPQLAFSSFLGGSGGDYGNGVAVDSAGNAYAAGITPSANFPTRTGAFQ